MRAFRRVLGVVAGVACLLVVVGSGVAVAAPGGFGIGEGSDSGEFSGPRGIAVEQASGDVYVADRGNNRVEKFGGGGEFLFGWGWGVADGRTNALQTCTTRCSMGLGGGGAGQFSEPDGVAVDNDLFSSSYRDVYVVDAGNRRIEKFDSAGNFLLMFGGEVNETTKGDVCLAGEACGTGTSGTGPGEFEMSEGNAIAVSASGTVYVGDLNRVEEFNPEGVYVGQIPLAGAGSIRAVTVDSSGDVYVNGSELAGVRKYDTSGTELGAPRDTAGEPGGYFARGFITLGASGELFIADSEHILQYDPSGNEVARFDAGNENGSAGIAFADGIGELYVLNSGSVRVVSPPLPGPLVVSESADELQPTTATVHALLNPEGHATTYHVEYGATTSYGSNTSSTAVSGSAFEDEPVSVTLSDLQPRTVYHYRVSTTNSAGTTFGPDETFTTLPPASIDSESVSDVASTGATLAAQINPLGRNTTYRFEYGPSVAYGSSIPVPDGNAGSGTTDVPLSALVTGLTPGTAYHYRVVATNSLGTVEGPDHVFTTQNSEAPGLPDGRQWEMVSPPDKRGVALESISGRGGTDIQASADGSAITYAAQAPIDVDPQGNRNIAVSQILSTRTATGWSSQEIATPHEEVTGTAGAIELSEYRIFSPDLSAGLVEPEGDTPLSPQATEKTPYRRESNGEYTPLVTAANVPAGTEFGQLEANGNETLGDVKFAGTSPDLSHVVLSSSPALTEGVAATEGKDNLFEWADGALRLVSVLPNGKAVTEEGESATLGLGLSSGDDVRHAVSDDGSRVIWEASHEGEHGLYMRDVSRGETVQLDAVEAGAEGGSGTAIFATASSDGSKVFFTDDARLTTDSTALPRGGSGERDLYMCEIGEAAGKLVCRLKDLTVDHDAGKAADVQGTVIGASENGRYAYFVANGVLAAGATHGDCIGPSGTGESARVCNMYVYDATTGEVRFIAQLTNENLADWTVASLGELTAGISPDGRYLAFMSERSLTGYDNRDARSGQPDVEVFLYDADTGRVTCASCNPSGGRPSGVFDAGGFPGLLVDHSGAQGAIWPGHWLAGSLPGWTDVTAFTAFYRSRYLSDSGRLFFDSADALVPSDANGKEDVYEYEPGGVGSCGRESGCVGLISSGGSGEESAFLDASEGGNDVFFLTAAQLSPADQDHALDVYDAHVCTPESPCASPPPPSPPACEGDACQNPVAPPNDATPGSFTFHGPGNVTPPAPKPIVKAKAKPLTRAQKLAKALKTCKKDRSKKRRSACEKKARKLYGRGK
jgi:hypothetical protein